MVEKFFKLITFPQDKANHAFWLTFAFAILVLFVPDYLALMTIVVIAGSKELYDSRHKDIHTVDLMDFLYGVIPGTVIVLIGIIQRII